MPEASNDIFDFIIFRHFGLICLILTIFSSGLQKLYSLFRVRKNPELKDGYQKVILGYLVFMGLPWIIIAIGELIYGLSGILFLFLLKDGNPVSWLFYTTLFCEYMLFIIWVWFWGGGEYLYKHNLMFYRFSSPLAAKILFTLMVLGGIIGFMIFMSLNLSI